MNPPVRIPLPLICLAFLLGTVIAYWPAMHGGLLWDDDDWTRNLTPLVQDLSGLARMWISPTALQQYYPMSGTTFWIDHHLWGDATFPMHVENVLLHALNAFLLAIVLRQLRVPGAWLAGAVFAVHPVMVESAAWITERKNVLSGMFFLLSIRSYATWAGWATDETTGHRRTYVWALMWFFAALLSKITAFSLPPMLLLIAWWKHGRLTWRRDVRPTLPFFAIAIALGVLVSWLETYHVGANGAQWMMTFPERVLVAGRALLFYPGKLLLPVNLCFVYERWIPDGASLTQWLFPAGAAAVIAAAWHWRGRIGRGPIVAILCYAGALFPVLGFMNVYGMVFSFVWDHWVYLPAMPLIALAIGSVFGATERWQRHPAFIAACGILIAVLAILTWRQAAMYQSLETLWQTTLQRNPKCWLAHNNLGFDRYKQGNFTEAKAHYEAAIGLNPTYALALSNLGAMLMEQGNLKDSEEALRRAVKADPTLVDARGNLGNLLGSLGKFDDALAAFTELIKAYPEYGAVWNNYGNILAHAGRNNEAIEAFRAAVKYDPGNARTHYNLGASLHQASQLKEAIEQYRLVLTLAPNDAMTHNNLGFALQQSGRCAEARSEYETALRIIPGITTATGNLAFLLATDPDASARDGKRSMALANQAVQATSYNDANALKALAAAHAELGDFTSALDAAKQAERIATEQNDSGTLKEITELLQAYSNRQPWRIPAPKP